MNHFNSNSYYEETKLTHNIYIEELHKLILKLIDEEIHLFLKLLNF